MVIGRRCHRFTSNSLASVMPIMTNPQCLGHECQDFNWLTLPFSLSDYLQCRVKQVQRLLIDHTFVLFSYNRSILRASKHFCRAPTPVQKHRYPPCERRDVLYANCDMLGARRPYCVSHPRGQEESVR